MENGDCRECKSFNFCYRDIRDYSLDIPLIYDMLKAIQRRDLCVNNDKADWEKKS